MSKQHNKPGQLTDDDMMGDVPVQEEHLLAEPSAEAAPKPEDMAKEREENAMLKAQLAEANERVLRTMAEMKNIQTRAQQDIAKAHKYGVEKLLEELIPVLDSLEQSLTVKGDDNDVVKSMREGMALTLQMLQKVLAKFGVKEINPAQEMFNPAFHEVMMAQENSELPPRTILQVLQKGYQLHDRIIRPARVIIVKGDA